MNDKIEQQNLPYPGDSRSHVMKMMSINEDDEHLMLSDVCNFNKYENFYIIEMMFI